MVKVVLKFEDNKIKAEIFVFDTLKNSLTGISKEIIQSGSQQDINPIIKQSDHQLTGLVGDGHGGHQTKNLINFKQELIIKKIEKTDSNLAMELTKDICSDCVDGAVLALFKLYSDNDNPFLFFDFTSRGDIQLLIYENNTLLHTNKLHKLNDDNPEENIVDLKFLEHLNCQIIDDSYDFYINETGDQIITPYGRRKYYKFLNDNKIACFGHVGHQNSSTEVPSFHKKYCLDKNQTYKFIICSDGVSDVFNFNDQFLIEKNAKEICDEAVNRWNKMWYLYDNRPGCKGQIHGPDTYLKSCPDDCSCISFVYNPSK